MTVPKAMNVSMPISTDVSFSLIPFDVIPKKETTPRIGNNTKPLIEASLVLSMLSNNSKIK